MSRGPLHKLTDTKIESKLKLARAAVQANQGKPILLGDGGGLTLQISKTGSCSWLYRYMLQGKAKAIGLGAYPQISLREARVLAADKRRMTAQKVDPLADKRARESDEQASADRSFFAKCAHEYIAAHRSEWKSSKHIQQWENTLATYAFPVIGSIPIGQINTAQVREILAPIWETKHETASRLRGRIEAVIDWASAHGLREGDNPARWKGHLEHLLARSTIASRTTKHHPALPHADIRAFMTQLAVQEGMARWALEFLILTAARTSEVKDATWSEVDPERLLWTIPAERMKASKEHRVPLCKRACQILTTVRPWASGRYIFPGGRKDSPLSNMAMSMLLRRMGFLDITVHGFRSTFRDFVAEMTTHDYSTAEAALAHRVHDKVAAAYARSDLLDKRAHLMNEWEAYCYDQVN